MLIAGTEFCVNETHEYELYLAIEDRMPHIVYPAATLATFSLSIVEELVFDFFIALDTISFIGKAEVRHIRTHLAVL